MAKRTTKTGIHLFRLTPDYTKRVLKSLEGYYKIYHNEPGDIATLEAKRALEFLLQGLGIKGEEFPNQDLIYFCDRLNLVTEKFYLPGDGEKEKFALGKFPGKKSPTKIDYKDKTQITTMKRNLLKEYPFLNRKDMNHNIDSYCTISIRINKMLNSDEMTDKNNSSLKNLIEAQIKLGDFLGIDESARQKMKQVENRGDIGYLAEQFEKTLNEYPDIMHRMKFFELRLLLNKYERKEISRELFELVSYAAMSLEDAYIFVNENKEEYE